MSNNLSKKEHVSFFEGIKIFLKKILKKQSIQTMIEPQDKQLEKIEKPKNAEDKTKESFENYLKVEIKSDYENDKKREEFVKNLEKNPKLFYELPIEKLQKLEEYYKESIKKYEEKLAKIKSTTK